MIQHVIFIQQTHMRVGNVRHKQIFIVREKGIVSLVAGQGGLLLIGFFLNLSGQIGDNSNEKIDAALFHQFEIGGNRVNRPALKRMGGSGLHLYPQGSRVKAPYDCRHGYSPVSQRGNPNRIACFANLDIIVIKPGQFFLHILTGFAFTHDLPILPDSGD